MKAKQIGTKIDRNPAKHTPKPRNAGPRLQKLLVKNRLVPIYSITEEAVFLVGYRRKSYSRKSHQTPIVLAAPVPIARIKPEPKPETLCNTESKK